MYIISYILCHDGAPGEEGQVVVRTIMESADGNMGFNAQTGQYVDMIKETQVVISEWQGKRTQGQRIATAGV